MSIPISYCALVRAVDEPEFRGRFHEIMKRNIKCGHFSIMSCSCSPPCRELTTEELDKLSEFCENEDNKWPE